MIYNEFQYGHTPVTKNIFQKGLLLFGVIYGAGP